MNFTINELCKSATAQRKKIDNTPTDAVKKELERLIEDVLLPLRNKYGKPIIVSSGYRCPKLNDAVGGVKNSLHKYGQAADIHSVSDSKKDNEELFNVAKEMIKNKEITVGLLINEYNFDWVHISTTNGKLKNQIIAIK